MRLTAYACGLVCLLAAPAAADVTLTATTTGKAIINLGGEQTTRIKGNKMRSDSVQGGDSMSVIIDVDEQQMISLDHRKKEATVWTLAEMREVLSKVANAEPKVKLTPTGATKQIAGASCTVHDFAVSVPFTPMEGQNVNLAMTGPTCLAKDAPGAADFKQFYTAAAEKGFIFGDPRAAKGNPAHARGMTEMYRAMANAGMPLDQQMNMAFEGSGMFASIMNKMGKANFTTTVTKIDTAPLTADLFAVPTGYKVKKP
jgi:Domain of unknown function (DUF4412)